MPEVWGIPMAAAWTRRSGPAGSGCGWPLRRWSRPGPATGRSRSGSGCRGWAWTGGGGRWLLAAGRRWRRRALAARSASSARRSSPSWKKSWMPGRRPRAIWISAGRWRGSRSRSGGVRRRLGRYRSDQTIPNLPLCLQRLPIDPRQSRGARSNRRYTARVGCRDLADSSAVAIESAVSI